MPIFNISTITFCTPGKVLIISVINEHGFALCTSVFVYVSATTALHKMSKNQAIEEKYVFIGLVLLIAMGDNFGYGEVSFHTYFNPSHNRMLNPVK